LYVKAACEHGCGYTEGREGFWQRLWTDPLAIFTAILVAFNFILAFAGVRAANAAKRAADLVPALERAYVFVDIARQHLGAAIASLRPGDGVKNVPPVVWVRATNYGKTPAIIKAVGGTLKLQADEILPEYTAEPLDGEIVLAGAGTEIPDYKLGDIPKPSPQKLFMQKGEKLTTEDKVAWDAGATFWFAGTIIYDDVFGREHETQFWYKLDRPDLRDSKLQRYGDRRGNKRT
jgi:hypothetical protein